MNTVLVGGAFDYFDLGFVKILELIVIEGDKMINLVVVFVPVFCHIGRIFKREIDAILELEPAGFVVG